MLRREVLTGLLGLAASPALGQSSAPGVPGLQLGAASPFDPSVVVEKARALAAQSYVPPTAIPAPWTEIDYDA